MANKVKYNLKNVHWALATTTGYSSTVSAWPGAVNIALTPQGDDYTFYADGIAYFEYHTNNGYEGDLECALVPEDFKKQVLGEVLDNNGNLIELDDVDTVNFALGFQIDGDVNENFYWFYNCKASRPNVEGSTKEESVEVQTETLSFSNKPDPRISVGTKHPVKAKSGEASTTTAGAWFSAVVVPNVTLG